MTHGDLDQFVSGDIISGSKLFMMVPIVRAVVCPDGSLVFLKKCELKQAYGDLMSWGLPIRREMLNQ